MVVIQHIPVGAGGLASITFNAIPQNYTDLYLVVSSRVTADPSAVNQNIGIRFNGLSTEQSTTELFSVGSSAGSASLSELRMGYTSSQYATADNFGTATAYIANYTSNQYKAVSAEGAAEGNDLGMYQAVDAGLWSNTAAITSLTVVAANGGHSFLEYSSATLYGITAGSDGITAVS